MAKEFTALRCLEPPLSYYEAVANLTSFSFFIGSKVLIPPTNPPTPPEFKIVIRERVVPSQCPPSTIHRSEHFHRGQHKPNRQSGLVSLILFLKMEKIIPKHLLVA